MPTGVVPDTRDVAVGARLDMATQRCGPALHNRACGAPDVGRPGMGAFIVGIARAEDILQGEEPHAVPQQNDRQNVYRLFL